jgi:FkbM family methyltransferase
MRRIINNISNHSNWLSYYFYKYFTNKKRHFIFKCRSGIEIAVPPRLMQTYKECFFDETYFKGFPARLLTIPARNVIDIGANVGYFSLFMFARYPAAKIYSFEPMPVNFELLSQYKNENAQLDFTIVNKAVTGTGEKSIKLNYDSTDAFTTGAGIFANTTSKDQLEVTATSLADIMFEHKVSRIDFLKLDCEGSEYTILYNAPPDVLDNISVISMETHSGQAANENAPALISFLKARDFQVNFSNNIIWAWKLPLVKNGLAKLSG